MRLIEESIPVKSIYIKEAEEPESQGKPFEGLINTISSEFSWYGESLLNFQAIPIYPIEPLFKVFHYSQQAIEYKQNNITEQMIAQNYMGIIMQSNYNAPIKYEL